MANGIIEVFTSDIRNQETVERCVRFYLHLPLDEREKAERFLHEDDRLRFIAGRRMIRTLASERLGISEPEILLTDHGKPYIHGADGFHFNISHSGDLVVLAVSDTPVGIDIERNVPVEWREISKTFGVKEREMLDKTDDPLGCFYRIWTIREAFSKAVGEGLSLFENEQPDINYEPGTVYHRSKTMYVNSRFMSGYTLSLCSASPLVNNAVFYRYDT